jgi:hypothetical protein
VTDHQRAGRIQGSRDLPVEFNVPPPDESAVKLMDSGPSQNNAGKFSAGLE